MRGGMNRVILATMTDAIAVRSLDFAYAGQDGLLFRDLSLSVPSGARCLLLGENGVGKTTLLRILGGKHMVAREAVTVLSASAFHDTALVHRVAFLGGPFPFDVDMSVTEILSARPLAPALVRRMGCLIDVLCID